MIGQAPDAVVIQPQLASRGQGQRAQLDLEREKFAILAGERHQFSDVLRRHALVLLHEILADLECETRPKSRHASPAIDDDTIEVRRTVDQVQNLQVGLAKTHRA